MRRLPATLIGISGLLALVACSGSSHAPSKHTTATVHVRSFLVSTHLDANGVQKTFRAPMVDDRVLATDARGSRTSAVVDTHGTATLRLGVGSYALTSSLQDACRTYRLDLRAGEEMTVDLACAAP